jgi:CheY-like chemotaxis protein
LCNNFAFAQETGAIAGMPMLTILLADDNPINQKVVATLLRRGGHTVDIASNGREAVEAAQTRDYDAILMDMHMPEMDGLDATRAIRKLGTPVSQATIVALTAADAGGDIRNCLDAGMNHFLPKPVQAERLQRMFAELAAVKDKREKRRA